MKQGVATHDHAPVLLIHISRMNNVEGGRRIQENVVTEGCRGIWCLRLGSCRDSCDLLL